MVTKKKKINGWGIFGIILGIIVIILTIFLSVLLNVDSFAIDNYGTTEGKYGGVMSSVENIVEANPRYIDIAMLGSHDAHTSDLNKKGPVDHDIDGSTLATFSPIVSGMLYRFAVTQTVGIYDQLMQGSRYLHIKMTDFDGTWYTSHSTLAGTLKSKILDLLKFLNDCSKENKGEIVTLFLHTIYIAEGNNLYNFHNWLASVKLDGKCIYDYVYYDKAKSVDISSLTYNDLTKNGTQPGLVLFDRREESKYKEYWDENIDKDDYLYFFDIDKDAYNPWNSNIYSDKLIELIDANAKQVENNNEWDNKLRINQTQAAFVLNEGLDFFRGINSWSLLNIARKHNEKLVNDLRFDEWLKAMPVFQVDFVNSTDGNFNDIVNRKILDYNQKMVNDILSH